MALSDVERVCCICNQLTKMPPRIGHIILIDEPLALLSSETEYTLYASLFIYHAILMLHDEDGIDDDLF